MCGGFAKVRGTILAVAIALGVYIGVPLFMEITICPDANLWVCLALTAHRATFWQSAGSDADMQRRFCVAAVGKSRIILLIIRIVLVETGTPDIYIARVVRWSHVHLPQTFLQAWIAY